MNQTLFRVAGGIAMAFFLGACATPAGKQVDVRMLDETTYEREPFVELYNQEPERPYHVIAEISISDQAGTPVSQVLANLRSRASEIGAQALIVDDQSEREPPRIEMDSGGEYRTSPGERIPRFEAKAIRWVDE